MSRRLLCCSAAALAVFSAPALALATRPRPRTASELLSAAEVAKLLGIAAARIDSINSGFNELTKVDLCSWYAKEGQPEGVMVKLRRAANPGEAPVQMIAARVDDDFSGERTPESIAGVGEEAQYLGYPDGRGGTIIVRQGASVLTLTGSPSKAALIAAAKLALPRL